MTNKELTVIQAARRLGITVDALYRLIYAARLPARKEEGRWLLPARAGEARRKAREARRETARG